MPRRCRYEKAALAGGNEPRPKAGFLFAQKPTFGYGFDTCKSRSPAKHGAKVLICHRFVGESEGTLLAHFLGGAKKSAESRTG